MDFSEPEAHPVKILTVVGARPQFIKAAAVSRAIAAQAAIREIIVHTGQHFDEKMSKIFFQEMKIPVPDYNLQIHSMSHGAMTGRMLERLEEVMLQEKPDYVLVYGDTNSTLAGTLAARKLHVNVVHVEAGLRSHNLYMPEETNRIVADRLSSLLCCPTEQAVQNLYQEGFQKFPCRIVKTGDVMLDAALFYSAYSGEKSSVLEQLHLQEETFILCTLHREENTEDFNRLISIVEALNEISQEVRCIFPVHPRTRKKLEQGSLKISFELIEPVGYFDMLELLKHTRLVMTDSGGLQKEAFFFKKPCLTLREETEWVELVEHRCNLIAGAAKERILSQYASAKSLQGDFGVELYGNGKAAEKIVQAILDLS